MRAKVTLYVRTKEGDGYRMDPVAFKKGKPVAPEGALSFYLRYSVNGKRSSEPVGEDLNLAHVRLQNKGFELEAKRLGRDVQSPAPLVSASAKTFQQAFHDFMKGNGKEGEEAIAGKEDLATRSREAYEHVLREFVQHCGPDKLLTTETARPCALSYRAWLFARQKPKPFSKTTIKNRMVFVNMFMRKFKIFNVYGKDEWPKPTKKKPDAFSNEQMNAILKATKTDSEWLLVQLFLTSGGRRNEIVYLTKADVSIHKDENGKEGGLVKFHEKPEFNWNTKGRHDREVNIPLAIAQRILASSPEGLLFPNTEGRPDRHLGRILRPILQRAGLYRKGSLFHKMRRTHATLKSERATIQTIQQDLGHQNIATTMKYLAAVEAKSAKAGQIADDTFGGFVKKRVKKRA